jgi:hypothetical protein
MHRIEIKIEVEVKLIDFLVQKHFVIYEFQMKNEIRFQDYF